MTDKLKDDIFTDYIRLDSSMLVANALLELCSDPSGLGVIFDKGQPVTLVKAEDLAAHGNAGELELRSILPVLPPGILASPETTLNGLLESPAISALDNGARGALLVEGDKLLGAFTEASIDGALLKFSALAHGERAAVTASDSGLAGSINTPRVILYCDEFGHRNELTFFNRSKPPACEVQVPRIHPLRLV